MGLWVKRVFLPLTVLAVLALAAACGGKKATEGSAANGGGGTGEGGEIEAVKLIGAWVDAGAPEKDAFTFTAKDGKTYKATFEKDILPLFTESNKWGPNLPACTSCHNAVDANSKHEMGLGDYKGIMTGADSISNPQSPAPIIVPGDWNNSVLRHRLRDNRMPPGITFDITEANRDGPVVKTKSGGEIEAVKLIGAWVDAGAKEKESFTFTGKDGKEYKGTFADDILPLFTEANKWGANLPACTSCHSGVDANSKHEMGLGSYADIMKGADSVSNPQSPAPIIIPGDWNNSVLRKRLRDNRMPPGITFDITEQNRDGPIVKAGTLAQ